MSRRHHHHMQPYDYDRFADHSHSRDRGDQARGIEYQDDSLSSINSDEESYLHHRDKKGNYYLKPETINKAPKLDKPLNIEPPYHQKESYHQKEPYHQKSLESYNQKNVEPYGQKNIEPYNQKNLEAYNQKNIEPYGQKNIDSYSQKNIDSYSQKSIDSYGQKNIDSYSQKNVDSYGQKEMPKVQYTAPPKAQFTAPPSTPDPTAERLSRLETMLEKLVKHNVAQPSASEPLAAKGDKSGSEKRSQFSLEPRRHNFTTSMWINKIQDVSIQNNWDEKTTVSYMGTQMSGIIKAWYNSLPNYGYTWPEWKILISKMFPDNTDFVTSLKRLVTRLKQADEGMTTYYFSKMYLIECCKITGEDAVSCLIDGLNNQSVQEQAKSQNFLTPETLYSQFLAVLPEYTVDYAPVVPAANDPPLSQWYYQEPDPVIEAPKAEMAVSEQQFGYESFPREEFDFHPPPKPLFEDEAQVLKRAAMPVHSRLDKRFMKPKKNSKTPMAAKICSICMGRGHLARNCRNRNVDKMMCCKSRPHSSCFYKSCAVNGRQVECFVDTGCTAVTIKEHVARALGLAVTPTLGRIQAYGGGFVPIVGAAEVELCVDSVGARVRSVIVPDHVQETAVVVGQDFLNQEHMCAVLSNETLNIFKTSD